MKNFLLALFLISTFDIYSHEFNPAHLVIEQSNKSVKQTSQSTQPIV